MKGKVTKWNSINEFIIFHIEQSEHVFVRNLVLTHNMNGSICTNLFIVKCLMDITNYQDIMKEFIEVYNHEKL